MLRRNLRDLGMLITTILNQILVRVRIKVVEAAS